MALCLNTCLKSLPFKQIWKVPGNDLLLAPASQIGMLGYALIALQLYYYFAWTILTPSCGPLYGRSLDGTPMNRMYEGVLLGTVIPYPADGLNYTVTIFSLFLVLLKGTSIRKNCIP